MHVNITQLVAAVLEAAPFMLPEMNIGTRYLYNSIYCPLARGEEVRLSCLDFSAFDSEDINSFNDLFNNVLDQNNCQANGIAEILRKIAPVSKSASYV